MKRGIDGARGLDGTRGLDAASEPERGAKDTRTSDPVRRAIELESRMRERRQRWAQADDSDHARDRAVSAPVGSGLMPSGASAAEPGAADPIAMDPIAMDPIASGRRSAPDESAAAGGFPRSATMRWIVRHPVATLSLTASVAMLLASSRPTRAFVPIVATFMREPAVRAVAASVLEGARRRPPRDRAAASRR